MIQTTTKRPYLQTGECITCDYDCEWLEDVLHEGQKVKVRLVAIDNGKLALSMIGVKQ